MVTPTRRNAFLHKMLKRGDNELQSEEHINEGVSSPKLEQFLYKTRWIKKFNLNSPSKLNLQVNSPQEVVNDRRPSTPSTPMSDEMQDLQRIRRDFEIEFSSPRKGHNEATPFRPQKFVKRMVAALEQKYNGYREMKVEKASSKLKGNSVNAAGEFQVRKAYLNETFVIRQQRKSSKRLTESPERPAYFEDDEKGNISEHTFIIEEGSLRKVKPPPDDKHHHHHVALKKKDQQHLEIESPARQRSDSMIKRENAPKIIGALLKKPIEVEETEIDWIPIMNQKLPRKSSFKKLLMLLTGKRNPNKGNKLYCSPCDEPKEPGDSGYDEKSSSSSSLSSRTSAELPKNPAKNLSTFVSSPESGIESPEKIPDHQEIIEEEIFTPAKKFLFEQVPRDEVRLSLGPFFPASSKPVEKSPSKNPETTSINTSLSPPSSPVAPLPKHPYVSPLPKHPSVSQICKDNSIMSIEEFSQMDLRRMPSWKFPSSEVIYDTPRNYLSISNPDLVLRDKYRTNNFQCYNEIIYDYPRNHMTNTRPKSSVYEDCLSLQRRIADFNSSITIRSTNFYASPDEPQEIYATVKPRNTRVLSSQQLLRSMAETEDNQLKAPYLVNSFRSQQTTIL